MPNHAKKNVETGEAALPALIYQISELKRQLEEKEKETAEQDKLRLKELLKKVLNSEPEVKQPLISIAKRRHSIAFGFGSGYSSVMSRHPRLSAEVKWSDRFRVGEEIENDVDMIIEESQVDENPIGREEEGKENRRSGTGQPSKMTQELENQRIRAEACEKALIKEKEKTKKMEEELAKAEEKSKMWEEKATMIEKKYADLKKRGLAMLESKDEKAKSLEKELEKNGQERKELEKKLAKEQKYRKRKEEEMEQANQLIKTAFEDERQMRREKEMEHLMERSERKALQDKLQEMVSDDAN